MPSFNQALKWLLQGKSVKRTYWSDHCPNMILDWNKRDIVWDEDGSEVDFMTEFSTSNDWVVVEDPDKITMPMSFEIEFTGFSLSPGGFGEFLGYEGKLKTLKDFHKSYLRHTCPIIETVSTKTLKQEAINYIKKLEEKRKTDPERFDYNSKEKAMNDFAKVATIHWIKHFFNITEEDLE